jgi:hypothetical protein
MNYLGAQVSILRLGISSSVYCWVPHPCVVSSGMGGKATKRRVRLAICLRELSESTGHSLFLGKLVFEISRQLAYVGRRTE